ncbi:hypothetical protein A3D69_04020 [Candidatus Uhrbacteria bacterium RIFCSPHIGHO2_02_FULL_54_11]|nr:MAG: Aspartate racemase [Parcubacteria group bacterium GW2011_GWA2_53_21]OGL72372.1 MAG: hypothetical protein A3D69_04020 [Candidatus Uhrbacteria bacterium RIFCSPHIGHO2_02_FULL_54_11]
MTHKTIGIIGGAGPLATVDFERRLLALANAASDQEFPIIITFNNSQIPDRTKAILDRGSNPTKEIIRTIETLKHAGAEILCFPCNTSHAFYEEFAPALQGVEFVHLPRAVKEYMKTYLPDIKTIGILCTEGTRLSGVYDRKLGKEYAIIYPKETTQTHCVSQAIYGKRGIKAGYTTEPRAILKEAVDELVELGAEAILLGCTELPLVLKKARVPLIDTSEVLAKAVLARASVPRSS